MEKNYIAPKTTVIEITNVQYMLTESIGMGEGPIDSGEAMSRRFSELIDLDEDEEDESF